MSCHNENKVIITYLKIGTTIPYAVDFIRKWLEKREHGPFQSRAS